MHSREATRVCPFTFTQHSLSHQAECNGRASKRRTQPVSLEAAIAAAGQLMHGVNENQQGEEQVATAMKALELARAGVRIRRGPMTMHFQSPSCCLKGHL